MCDTRTQTYGRYTGAAEMTDEALAELIIAKLAIAPSISFAAIASTAHKSGRSYDLLAPLPLVDTVSLYYSLCPLPICVFFSSSFC